MNKEIVSPYQKSLQELKKFIKSNQDELEYFHCMHKYSLFMDYLENLRKRNQKYEEEITPFLEAIRLQNNWVKEIVPSLYQAPNELWIKGKREPSIHVKYDLKKNIYLPFGEIENNFFLALQKKKRMQVIENSKEILLDIRKIILKYPFKEECLRSASNTFWIVHSSYSEVAIGFGNSVLLRIDLKNLQLIENVENLEEKQVKTLLRKLYLAYK